MQEQKALIENKPIFEKRGQSGGTVGTVILLVVGVGVSVLILIFVGVLSGQTYELTEDKIAEIGNNAVINEGFTILTDVGQQLDHHDIQTASISIFNATNDVIGAGNFTIDTAQGILTLNSGIWNNTQGYINYTWGSETVRGSVQSGLVSSFEALENTGSYLPIVVLAVVIALVLGLVMTFTMVGGSGGGSSAL